MLAKIPPKGFNTWNTFGENINEEMIKQTADAMVEKGLLDAGYEYLVIDDCWSERERDKVTGEIVADHIKFPNGMKAVADYVHSKGLKFGMYSCAGVRTCADYPGSFDHEYLDAKTFAGFGVDFLKCDYCNRPQEPDGALLYRKISMALKSSGREILLSACNWGSDDVHRWIRSTGAHMYRSTGDINDSFASFRDIAASQIDNLAYSAPGCYNDIDMLTVGMYAKGNVGSTGCTAEEYKTQFAIWCMFASPLMLGCDIRSIDDEMLALVKNKHLLRINADEEGRPPFVAFSRGEKNERSVLGRVLSDNEIAILELNMTDRDDSGWIFLESFGIPASSGKGLQVIDAFTGEDAGVINEFRRDILPPHSCKMYIGKIVDLK